MLRKASSHQSAVPDSHDSKLVEAYIKGVKTEIELTHYNIGAATEKSLPSILTKPH